MEREEGMGLEFEARKEKKKKHKGKASSLIQVCGDEMGKVVEAHMNSGEGAGKKKKRKREKKGDDTVMGNVSGEEAIPKHGEMRVAAEYEDAAKVSNKAGGELVQNVRTNGEVEGQTSVVNIVQKGDFAVKESKRENRNHGKNSGSEMLETRVEKVETERSEIQANIDVENEGNVQSTASESCIGDREAVAVDDRKKKKKKKKAELETHADVGDGNRDAEAVYVEDGKRRKKKRAISENYVTVEDSDRIVEAVDVENGKRRKEKRSKSEKHVIAEDRERAMEAFNVEDGTKSEKHVNVEDRDRDMDAIDAEVGNKRNKMEAKSEEHFNVEVGDKVVEDVNVEDGIKKKKKKKRAKSEMHVNVEDSDRNMESVNVDDKKLRKNKVESEKHANLEDIDREMEGVNLEDGNKRKKEKKKVKAEKHVHIENFNRNEAVNEEAVIIEDGEQNKASDAGFSQPDGPSDEHQVLVRGKRFSKEEDKILSEAVLRYIEERGLGVDGLKMVLHCRSHPEVKNHPEVLDCWKVIGEAIPWRPHKSVYSRAHILFERSEESTWTPEEYEEVRKFYREHGANWRTLGDKLGRHRVHVKDAWRRLNLANHRKGPWSQEEYQTLFDLVNTDLLIRTLEDKKTRHGMLRDNICWTAISDRLGTRTNAICSMKWYKQLASPLVKQKLWADIDDYRLIDALSKLEASCIEDVDWDGLLEHRAGDVCQQRWDQMVKHIGEHVLESFPEQVSVLSKRYPAGLIEVMEIYDSKPVVDSV